uniref:Uncharacterized protein n=1 Tax=Knipowitschia caucasica TaxID=637954 RepID=A0AAV2KP49_KNICA
MGGRRRAAALTRADATRRRSKRAVCRCVDHTLQSTLSSVPLMPHTRTYTHQPGSDSGTCPCHIYTPPLEPRAWSPELGARLWGSAWTCSRKSSLD